MSVASLSTDSGYQDCLTHRDRVNLWRGQFIEEFTRAEMVVSEALVFLAGVATGGVKSLLPHLVGQRFAALREVVAVNGPFAIAGARVASVLNEFDELHYLRSFVCHGSSKVTQDRYDGWHLTLDLLTFHGAQAVLTVLQLSQTEADTALDRLRSARLRLDGHLKGMLAVLR